jgi:hypothetical protein
MGKEICSKRLEKCENQGLRSAVRGGALMEGFILLFTELFVDSGVAHHWILTKKVVELPVSLRSTTEWDLLVVSGNTLITASEAKSWVIPFLGNNFNNRTEEGMGSALDLWTAFRGQDFLIKSAAIFGLFFC